MLAQTFLSFSYFKVVVLHVCSRILKGITLTLFVYLCTSHSLSNPLQSGFCSQHSAKSAIMMKVTKEFLIPISNEHDFSWYCWNAISFIFPHSCLYSLWTHLSLSHSLCICVLQNFLDPLFFSIHKLAYSCGMNDLVYIDSQTCYFQIRPWS